MWQLRTCVPFTPQTTSVASRLHHTKKSLNDDDVDESLKFYYTLAVNWFIRGEPCRLVGASIVTAFSSSGLAVETMDGGWQMADGVDGDNDRHQLAMMTDETRHPSLLVNRRLIQTRPNISVSAASG